mmetsp:Transcript_22872/g.49823  ORF Transcript_22872/g.49823 Transcript_22872/m.49823 type:complete len:115 (-) Transcript_22872:293-637(-)
MGCTGLFGQSLNKQTSSTCLERRHELNRIESTCFFCVFACMPACQSCISGRPVHGDDGKQRNAMQRNQPKKNRKRMNKLLKRNKYMAMDMDIDGCRLDKRLSLYNIHSHKKRTR